MSEVVAIEVTDEEVAWLCDKYGEGYDVTPESHTLNRLAKKLWAALPVSETP
jgi:predicted 3-demethylubiquinone-9 3-methyltransferase (glyoxalase superfamily)